MKAARHWLRRVLYGTVSYGQNKKAYCCRRQIGPLSATRASFMRQQVGQYHSLQSELINRSWAGDAAPASRPTLYTTRPPKKYSGRDECVRSTSVRIQGTGIKGAGEVADKDAHFPSGSTWYCPGPISVALEGMRKLWCGRWQREGNISTIQNESIDRVHLCSVCSLHADFL
jgi:hypothetical protein